MKKKIVMSLVFAMSLAMAGAAASAEETAFTGEGLNEATKINIGYISSYPEWLINERQQIIESEFADEDIELNYVEFAYGVPAMEAVASGDIDFVITGDLPVITSISNGVGVQAIYSAIMDPYELAVVLPEGSEIAGITDLAGKSIGLPVGTDAHNFLGQLLAAADMTIEDITLVNLTASDLSAALTSGDIDAGVVWKPNATGIAEGINGTLTFESGSEETGNYIPLKLLSVRTAFAEENPELTARFVKAIDEIDTWIMDNLEETVSIMTEEQGVSDTYWSTLLTSEYNGDFDEADWDAAQKTLDFLVSNELIQNEFDINEFFTNVYLTEAMSLADAE